MTRTRARRLQADLPEVNEMATTVQVPERKQIHDEEEHRAFWDGIAACLHPGQRAARPRGADAPHRGRRRRRPDHLRGGAPQPLEHQPGARHGAVQPRRLADPARDARLPDRDPVRAAASCCSSAPTCSTSAASWTWSSTTSSSTTASASAPGDMWLVNDPWIGTAHQPDVNLMCPVFIDDELFCWVANNAHQNDVGGSLPGSFCPNAEDIYFDPIVHPAGADRQGRQDRPGDRGALPPPVAHPDRPRARPARERRRQPRGARAHPAAGRQVRQGDRQGRHARRPRRQPVLLQGAAEHDPRRRVGRALLPGGRRQRRPRRLQGRDAPSARRATG